MKAQFTADSRLLPKTREAHMGDLMSRELFESKIERIPESGCWIWIKKVDRGGYGVAVLGPSSYQRAHRLSWRIYRGVIPDGLHVCHQCDVRSCVNPSHLFVGTCLDNMRDAQRKGRLKGRPRKEGVQNTIVIARSSSQAYRPKINRDIAEEIRRSRREELLSYPALSRRFGLSLSHVWGICAGHAWK